MTALTAITATTAWDTWYSFSDRACNDTAIVYRWYVQTFFSAQAQARYIWIGKMLGCLIALAILYLQQWAENHVQASLAPVAVTEAVEVDPFSPDANPHHATVPAVMAAPVATLVIPVSPATLTSAELRKQCQSAGIKWRNAHGASKHLSKAEMLAALQGMDCWALSEDCLAS